MPQVSFSASHAVHTAESHQLPMQGTYSPSVVAHDWFTVRPLMQVPLVPGPHHSPGPHTFVPCVQASPAAPRRKHALPHWYPMAQYESVKQVPPVARRGWHDPGPLE